MSQQKPRKGDKDKSGLRTAAQLSGIGLQMGLTIYLGNLLGSWLDQKFEQDFWEIGMTLFAIFVSLYSVIKQANDLNK
ncbi:MAG: AtpZ/AtpI family protein [Pricia sp.]